MRIEGEGEGEGTGWTTEAGVGGRGEEEVGVAPILFVIVATPFVGNSCVS